MINIPRRYNLRPLLPRPETQDPPQEPAETEAHPSRRTLVAAACEACRYRKVKVLRSFKTDDQGLIVEPESVTVAAPAAQRAFAEDENVNTARSRQSRDTRP